MSALSFELIPGAYVRLPACPDWGVGQVQSSIGSQLTVNFEHAGKRVLNSAHVHIEMAEDDS